LSSMAKPDMPMALKALKTCALVAMAVIQWGIITTTITHMITPTTVMLTWTFNHPNRIDQSLRRGPCAPALEVPTLARAMACSVGSFDLGHDDPQKPFLVPSVGHTTNDFPLHILSCLLYLSPLLLVPFLMTTYSRATLFLLPSLPCIFLCPSMHRNTIIHSLLTHLNGMMSRLN